MFNEAQQLAITRTELDTVFFQNFQYDASRPGIATANTGELFKQITTEHSAYIGSVNKGPGLFSKIGESQTVPLSTPRVTNKYTILIEDFANSINYLCQASVRALSKLCKFGGTPSFAYAY